MTDGVSLLHNIVTIVRQSSKKYPLAKIDEEVFCIMVATGRLELPTPAL